MNITIIIPALQGTHQRSESPQPTTTPFPPITLSPTPTTNSAANTVGSNFSRISSTTSHYCPECNAFTNGETTSRPAPKEYEIPIILEDDNYYKENKTQSPQPQQSAERNETNEIIQEETLTSLEEASTQENTTDSEQLQGVIEETVQVQDSYETHYTESASSPETVIHVDPTETQSVEDDYEDDFEFYEESELNSKTFQEETYGVHATTITKTLGSLTENNDNERENGQESFNGSTDPQLSPPNKSGSPEQVKNEQANGVRMRTLKGSYRDPRRPSNYPQRLNKVTLARQALAREKKRVYIEERIQNYIQKFQPAQQFQYQKRPARKQRKRWVEDPPPVEEKMTQSSATPQGLLSTSVPPKSLADLQKEKFTNPIHQSLPDLDSQNYYVNHPSPSIFEEMSQTSIPVARVITRKSPFKSLPTDFTSSVPLPDAPASDTGLIYIPKSSNSGSEHESIEKWGNIEHGYRYSFRVRESGAVQMFDKSIQTVNSDFSHGYTLEFKKETVTPLRKFNSEIHLNTTKGSVPDNRDKILREITENVQLRHDGELRRAELVQRANDLQAGIKEKREKITRRHEFWHKKYIEESALTRPLEGSCNTLRGELNTVHRRLLAHLEGRDLPLRLRDGPSKKANYKIMAARLQHEIKELQQKVKAAKLRLESEIKLKEQADRETREMRNDLSHKKMLMSLARSQASTLPVVHPKPLPLPYESLLPRGYDPIHSRSYESLYARGYDPILGY